MTHLFTYLMASLSLCAAGWYLYHTDEPRAIYWVAAAVLNLATTRMT